MREKDWRSRKHGTQAMRARQGDLAGLTRALCLSFLAHTHVLFEYFFGPVLLADSSSYFHIFVCCVCLHT